jgi:NADH dehydrogenase
MFGGVILLTGATGTLGKPLLARLIGTGQPVRCLVRQPRRLGPHRVQVSIAAGNLADYHGFDNAMRGVDTVVHLASSIRDQMRGSIEELNGIATSRLVGAAERAGVKRFVFVTPIDASPYQSSRFMRSKALATEAVAAGAFESLIFESSIIYAPDDPWLSLVSKLSFLPLMPVPGDGRARFQPIWADDAADAILSALLREDGSADTSGRSDAGSHAHFIELAGPDVLTHDEMLRLAMRSHHRERPLLHLPRKTARRLLKLEEWYLGPSAFATWDEAQLMQFPAIPARGTSDVEALGVQPLAMPDVLGAR